MIETLKKLALFKGVPEYFLAGLETECQDVSLKQGEYLFHQGDEGEGMYIITEGTIEILAKSEDGQDRMITSLDSGHAFGEVTLLEINKRIASAKAKTHCKLQYLSIKKFTQLIENNDPNALRISHNIALILADRLKRANELITELSKTTAQKDSKLAVGSSSTQREVARFKKKLLNEGLF